MLQGIGKYKDSLNPSPFTVILETNTTVFVRVSTKNEKGWNRIKKNQKQKQKYSAS